MYIFFLVGVFYFFLYLGGYKIKNYFFIVFKSYIIFGMYLGYILILIYMYFSFKLKEKYVLKCIVYLILFFILELKIFFIR